MFQEEAVIKTAGRVAIITGGGQGIGKAITGRLLKEGIRVAFTDNDAEAGEETCDDLGRPDELLFVESDVSMEKDVKRVIEATVERFGSIDLLVNNAGVFLQKPISECDLTDWNRIISVNLTGPFLCAKYAASYLKRSMGAIINISSTRAIMSEPDTEAYAASKGGIVALTHALAISLGPDVRVNCISPGWIDVSGWKKKSLREKEELTETDHNQHPAGRVGRPEDIASTVLFLASADAGFITGANLIADGGMTRKMIYI
jgi:NAD(P)-dependent dehydrogenase (short-subunit alcohol dehydrogenase family)